MGIRLTAFLAVGFAIYFLFVFLNGYKRTNEDVKSNISFGIYWVQRYISSIPLTGIIGLALTLAAAYILRRRQREGMFSLLQSSSSIVVDMRIV